MWFIIILIVCSGLLTVGQAFWKVASASVHNSNLWGFIMQLLTNKYFFIGGVLYVIATFFWVYLLGKAEYSKVYPIFVGLGMLFSLLIGYFFFHETGNVLNKVIGVILILIGVLVIVKV